MQESVSMHKNPTPVRHSRMNQAKSEKKGKTEARRLMERKAAQQNKNFSEELEPVLHAEQRLTKLGEERIISPSHNMRPFAPSPKILKAPTFIFNAT